MAQTSEPGVQAGQQQAQQAMTAERLTEIRERVEAATPGPWYVAQGEFVSQADTHLAICRVNRPVVNDRLRGITRDGGAGSDQPNKDFIAHAPEDIAALLADNDRLRAALAAAEAREAARVARLTAEWLRAWLAAHPEVSEMAETERERSGDDGDH